MTQLVLTHVTSSRNRVSIFRRGLLARDTTHFNYPTARENVGEAVYGIVDDKWWGRNMLKSPDERAELWLMDVAGLPLEPDRILSYEGQETNTFRVLADIEPDRLNYCGYSDNAW